MMASGRRRSLRSRLVAAGFTDTARAAACLAEPALRSLLGDDAVAGPVLPAGRGGLPGEMAGEHGPGVVGLVEGLGRVADPDLALLALVRLTQAADGDAGRVLRTLLGRAAGLGAVGAQGAGVGQDGASQAGAGDDGSAHQGNSEAGGVAGAAGGVAGAAGGVAGGVAGAADEGRLTHLRRLLAVLGASSALGDVLVAHPELVAALQPAQAWDAPGTPAPAEQLQAAVHAQLTAARRDGADRLTAAARAQAALRVAYYGRLLAVVADDLTSTDPLAHVEVVGRRMAALVDAALEAGLIVARYRVGEQADAVRLAVIAMGKTGARELNYLSDVDVVYVVAPSSRRQPPEGTGASAAPAESATPAASAAPAESATPDATAAAGEMSEEALVGVGTAIATELAHVVSAPGAEPALWPLDAGLRPEGKDGALVRTLDSYRRYYQRWASSWEFQALLKARAAAGDRELGRAFEQLVDPLVWAASQRENFVDDARAMRRRVETESARPGDAPVMDRRIKLGPGGLRDVEFTVQLLQLVHGRADASLRVRPTLTALAALREGGYVSRQDADVLEAGYRFERLLEHRCQLLRLRRTHELPDSPARLRVVGRELTGLSLPVCLVPHPDPDAEPLSDPDTLRATFRSVKLRVRAVHEQVYYRPLLTVAATLSADELAMTQTAARERLAAGGYLDPEGALHHIRALTDGVSRRAAIQRHILPVIIAWLGDGPDPDGGLLSFRRLSETIGGSHWYLGTLRDSPVAARRLCQVLSGARWTTERLMERPEAIAWLDEDSELAPRPAGALGEEVRQLLRRRVDALAADAHGNLPAEDSPAVVGAMEALSSLRSRELLRAALADCLLGMDPLRTGRILTYATDAVLGGALAVATGLVLAERLGQVPQLPGPDGRWPQALADTAVIAMGRLGGQETTYASDADVLFVHQVRAGQDPGAAGAESDAVARLMLRLLASARPHPLEVDADLRPEGRQGPMSRSLDSYRDYYTRWASTWERQALLRARVAAGDREVGGAFTALVDPLRWAAGGLDQAGAREVRRLKARMESERLPRGVEASRHLKMGPGGLADVEWSAQVLQLQHAGTVPGLRTTSTLAALAAAREAGVLSMEDEEALRVAWLEASRVRAANVIGSGRDSGVKVEVLPSEPREVRVVARLVGLEPGREHELVNRYRRAARHARPVAERIIYGGLVPQASDPDGEAAAPSSAASRTAGRAVVGGATAGRTGTAGGTGAAGGTGGAASAGSTSAGAPSMRTGRASKPASGGVRRRPRRGGPFPWS